MRSAQRPKRTDGAPRVMTQERVYASPQALRRAVTDRLKAIAALNGRWTVNELQRQFAYDRLLARLYGIDDAGYSRAP